MVTRKSFFCLFTITSVLFISSWFFVLCSTNNNNFIDHSLLPDSKINNVIDDNISKLPRNRGILEDNKGVANKDEDECRCNIKDKDKDKDKSPALKVYMYDMDSEFHFGLLGWKPKGKSVWPDIRTEIPSYPGGLNLQHSIEYWLTLDLLASEYPNPPNARGAIRVRNSSQADCIFVPFFSSLSYNRYSKVNPNEKKNNNKVLQDRMVKFLKSRNEWKRSGGRDHVIMAHHPNSMLRARMKLWPAMFILADFGRYPESIANVHKDVIAPYKHVIKTYVNDESDFESRPTLLYFQGAIYRKDGGVIRQELFYLLRDEKDVHFSFGSIQKDGVKKASTGMHLSKFCLNIAGDTPSSNRLFDAIASHCVPVIISDDIELPYEDVLDYSEFCIFVRTSDSIKNDFLLNLLRGIKKDDWTRMWRKLKEIEYLYEFQFPSKEGDAVQMIWQSVARKVPNARRKVHQSWRFSRSVPHPENGLSRVPSPRNFW